MFRRSDLAAWMAHRDHPSLSILAPTHRTAPANRRDRIVVKNLVTQALARLDAEFARREVAGLVRGLERLVRHVDWEHTTEGLALFASRDKAQAFHLPFRVRPRVVLGETFATRDLLFTVNRAPRYRVLVLGEKATQLHDAWTDRIVGPAGKPFPMKHTGPGGTGRLPGGTGVNRSAVRDEAHREFFRTVDAAVAALQKEDALPLVVVGIDRYLAFYQEVTKVGDAILGLVAGSHEGLAPRELGRKVWPVAQAGLTLRRTRALSRLGQAVGANRHASGIDSVWRAAVQGQCAALLVEEDFHPAADVAPEGDRLLPPTGRGPATLDDAADEVIEKVVATGGEVYFVEPGTLGTHQGIAAILRY